jgi:hypothetical protein
MKQLLFFFVLAYCFYSPAQTDSLSCVKTKTILKELVLSINQWNQTAIRTDYRLACKKIDSVLELNSNCFKKYELSQLYLNLAENIAKTADFPEEKVTDYFKKAILSGSSSAVILNLHTGLYIKTNFPEQYKELEHLSDSMYVVSCNNFKNASINLQLGFLLRYMIRKDQDVRTREMIARSATQKRDTVLDEFVDEMNKVDSVNEVLLTEIFKQYGFPDYSLVGGEGSTASFIFEHMTPDFQIKYIHLLEEAIEKQKIFIGQRDFHFMIDKLLYKKYRITLYGTHFTKAPPEKDKAVINKYRRLLQLPEEK